MKLLNNKKALMWNDFKNFAIAAVLIFILIFISKGQLFGIDTHLSGITLSVTHDTDGDGVKDTFDASPCTYGDMKILTPEGGDIYYPVQRPIDSDGATGIDFCPTKIPAPASTLTCAGLTPYRGKALTCVMDRETEEVWCAISKTECDEILKVEYAK